MEVDDVPPLKAVVLWKLAMVPGIEFVSRKVPLVHCCHIPWIACEVLQPFYLVPQKPLTLIVETSLVPWSQMKPLVCQDRHSLRLEVLDALL